MKVLTLHQPWASLVALGVKTIETRSWSTKYRGPLAIHAGASKAGALQCSECWDALRREVTSDYEVPLGAIVAIANLVDVVPESDVSYSQSQTGWRTDVLRSGADHVERVFVGAEQLPYGDFSMGRYLWLLEDVVAVVPPVKFKGGQGLTKSWDPAAHSDAVPAS